MPEDDTQKDGLKHRHKEELPSIQSLEILNADPKAFKPSLDWVSLTLAPIPGCQAESTSETTNGEATVLPSTAKTDSPTIGSVLRKSIEAAGGRYELPVRVVREDHPRFDWDIQSMDLSVHDSVLEEGVCEARMEEIHGTIPFMDEVHEYTFDGEGRYTEWVYIGGTSDPPTSSKGRTFVACGKCSAASMHAFSRV